MNSFDCIYGSVLERVNSLRRRLVVIVECHFLQLDDIDDNVGYAYDKMAHAVWKSLRFRFQDNDSLSCWCQVLILSTHL